MHNIHILAVYNSQCPTSTESARWMWKENLSFLGYCTMLNGKFLLLIWENVFSLKHHCFPTNAESYTKIF